MNELKHPHGPLILASESSYKRELLARLGLAFESIGANLDESPRVAESPADTARRLARHKAELVAQAHPAAWVLGADQVIALGEQRFSKPETAARARAQLAALSGQTHQLFSAVALVAPGGALHEDLAAYQMQMRALTAAQISQYITEDHPLDCTDAYRIEASNIHLFHAIHGNDYTTIINLPLTRVHTLLEHANYF